MARYIDRKQSTQKLSDIVDDDLILSALRNLYYELSGIPTADVKEVVRGEWRAYTTNAYIGGKKEFANRKFYRCSECRYGSVVKSNFCPQCGSDMRKEYT